jgi:cysteine desulfurase/selenocysteine lyase
MKDFRKDFPILEREINGNKLVYLDNAATSQKPKQVIDSISEYYSNYNANVHRGIHTLSEEATKLYEDSRKRVANFIGAQPEEVIFTKGTTESLNRVAISWGLKNLKKDDVVLLSDFEHHSNMIPWLEEVKVVGAKISYLESNENGEVTLDEVKKKISDNESKVKIISITHASNVLGTIVPVKEICKIAHEKGILVCVDGAQAVPHMKVNIQSIDCDFYAFSGHKILGPMGIGVLWVRKEILDKLEPYEYGGGMVDEVTYEKATYTEAPVKFEAGTPNVSGAIGLASAIGYLENIGMDEIRNHEIELNRYALEKLSSITNLEIIGPREAEKRTGLISFVVKNVHAHDIASVLNGFGVAVRSGHHCAMPYHRKHQISATTRISHYLYNTKEDIDKLIEGVNKAIELLG